MLSDNDLAGLRTAFDDLLGETCVITRATNVSDGQGGSTATWAAVGTALCTLSPLNRTSGDGFTVADQIKEVADYVVTLPAETDVTTKDRLTIGARTYEVSAVKEPRTYEIVRRVEAKIA